MEQMAHHRCIVCFALSAVHAVVLALTAAPAMSEAMLAVVSRDGRAVIATGRAGKGRGYAAVTNTLFTCLHTDSTIDVPANGEATTGPQFYLLKGNLDDLRKRFRADFGLSRDRRP